MSHTHSSCSQRARECSFRIVTEGSSACLCSGFQEVVKAGGVFSYLQCSDWRCASIAGMHRLRPRCEALETRWLCSFSAKSTVQPKKGILFTILLGFQLEVLWLLSSWPLIIPPHEIAPLKAWLKVFSKLAAQAIPSMFSASPKVWQYAACTQLSLFANCGHQIPRHRHAHRYNDLCKVGHISTMHNTSALPGSGPWVSEHSLH